MSVRGEAGRGPGGLIPPLRRLETFPWWALILIIAGLLVLYFISTSPTWQDTFIFISAGIQLTVTLTVASFAIALIVGLLAGLARQSGSGIAYTLATLYVEVIRGIPILVQLIYVAFVLVPAGVTTLNGLGTFLQLNLGIQPFVAMGDALASLRLRDVDMRIRAIIGLSIAYGAFEAEVFRAGIEAVSKGQMEAARSLGMSRGQAMRYIILPQAIRIVLPPLGNDFIAMLKDSSLVTVLAVRELTHLSLLNRARTFRSIETFNTVAFLYLSLTLSLSLLVKVMERRMTVEE